MARAQVSAWVRLLLACAVWILPMSTRSLGHWADARVAGALGSAPKAARPFSLSVLNPVAVNRMDDEALHTASLPLPVPVMACFLSASTHNAPFLPLIQDPADPPNGLNVPLRI